MYWNANFICWKRWIAASSSITPIDPSCRLECSAHVTLVLRLFVPLLRPWFTRFPSSSLYQYIADASTEDKNEDINKIQSLAWKAINDSLRTDIPLLYPPYQIAIAALHLAVVFQGGSTHFVGWPSRFSAWPRLTLMLLTPHPLTHLPFLLTGKEAKWSQWFAELNVDFEKIIEITRQIMNFYEVLKTYDEKNEMPGILERVPKPKTAPSRPPSQGPEADRETKNAGH